IGTEFRVALCRIFAAAGCQGRIASRFGRRIGDVTLFRASCQRHRKQTSPSHTHLLQKLSPIEKNRFPRHAAFWNKPAGVNDDVGHVNKMPDRKSDSTKKFPLSTTQQKQGEEQQPSLAYLIPGTA